MRVGWPEPCVVVDMNGRYRIVDNPINCVTRRSTALMRIDYDFGTLIE